MCLHSLPILAPAGWPPVSVFRCLGFLLLWLWPHLAVDRKLAERRIFPAIDIQRSGTRKEELLLDENTLRQVWVVRRMTSMLSANSVNPTDASEKVLERLSKTSSNAEFLATLSKDY